jgi:hypothetical protein
VQPGCSWEAVAYAAAPQLGVVPTLGMLCQPEYGSQCAPFATATVMDESWSEAVPSMVDDKWCHVRIYKQLMGKFPRRVCRELRGQLKTCELYSSFFVAILVPWRSICAQCMLAGSMIIAERAVLHCVVLVLLCIRGMVLQSPRFKGFCLALRLGLPKDISVMIADQVLER